MMAEAEADKVKIDSSNYMAPRSRSRSRERSPIRPVLNAYFTQNFRPKQVYGPTSVPQVTPTTPAERRKRKEDEVERRQTGGQGSSGSQDQDSSGSQAPGTCWKSGCQEQGAQGIRKARAWSQERICNCRICKTFPGRELSEEKGQDEPERRRLKVLLTWTPPRTRSRSPQGAKQRCRSPSMRTSDEEAVCRDKLWEEHEGGGDHQGREGHPL